MMSERFQTVAAMVGQYGYQVRHQVGGEDGTAWEITFDLGSLLGDVQPRLHHCAAPTEEALLTWLARWLPEHAATEWRQYALRLESDLARLKG